MKNTDLIWYHSSVLCPLSSVLGASSYQPAENRQTQKASLIPTGETHLPAETD